MCYWVIELSGELPTKSGVEEAILGKMPTKKASQRRLMLYFSKCFLMSPEITVINKGKILDCMYCPSIRVRRKMTKKNRLARSS